jgi:membrane protein YqaA with SNARE-associated domain
MNKIDLIKIKNKYQKISAYFLMILMILVTLILAIYSEQIIKIFNQASYIALFFLSFLASASLFLPMGPMQIAVVFLAVKLDPIISSIISGIASGLGESTGYIFGKEINQIKKINSNKYLKKLEKLEEKLLKKHKHLAVFILSMMPNPIFDFVGLYCGYKKIPYIEYLIITIIGRIVRYFILIYLGLTLNI